VAYGSNDGSSSTETFTGVSFGSSTDPRHVVVTVTVYYSGGSAVAPTSVTVDGGSCSKLVEVLNAAGEVVVSLWVTNTTVSATSGTVVVSSDGQTTTDIDTHAVTNLESTTARDTYTDTGTTLSGSIDFVQDGVVIASAVRPASSSLTASWGANLTETVDAAGDALVSRRSSGAAAQSAETTAKTVSCTFSSTTVNDVFVAVSLR
jgi:hypothetical protein